MRLRVQKSDVKARTYTYVPLKRNGSTTLNCYQRHTVYFLFHVPQNENTHTNKIKLTEAELRVHATARHFTLVIGQKTLDCSGSHQPSPYLYYS